MRLGASKCSSELLERSRSAFPVGNGMSEQLSYVAKHLSELIRGSFIKKGWSTFGKVNAEIIGFSELDFSYNKSDD